MKHTRRKLKWKFIILKNWIIHRAMDKLKFFDNSRHIIGCWKTRQVFFHYFLSSLSTSCSTWLHDLAGLRFRYRSHINYSFIWFNSFFSINYSRERYDFPLVFTLLLSLVSFAYHFLIIVDRWWRILFTLINTQQHSTLSWWQIWDCCQWIRIEMQLKLVSWYLICDWSC